MFETINLEDIKSIFDGNNARQAFQALLVTVVKHLPANAVALLEFHGDVLEPIAVIGLSEDTWGRRFKPENHPRLNILVQSECPIRFPSTTDLPDPYDGLIPGYGKKLDVHDCIGFGIKIGKETWGVLTLDAMEPGQLDPILIEDLEQLRSWLETVIPLILDKRKLENTKQQTLLESKQIIKKTEIIGQSQAINELIAQIKQVASSSLPVLISGETGTGKELVAKYIYMHSDRSQQPLVYVNCAALPDNLVETELFGHTRGAFSGASDNRSGRFEIADNGTLFLDEIGELPIGVQAKLLRAIQFGEIQRVGSDTLLNVNVRVIAATNRNLSEDVKSGKFRADLYHRLCVFPILVPPLNDRKEDLVLLSGYFLEQIRVQFGLGNLRLSSSALSLFHQYHWPGNVRELEHTLTRAALKAKTRCPHDKRTLTINDQDIEFLSPFESTTKESQVEQKQEYQKRSLKDATDMFQRELILREYQNNHENWSATAKSLGLYRSNLHRLAKRLGISTS